MSSMPGSPRSNQRDDSAHQVASDALPADAAAPSARFVDAQVFSAHPVGWMAAARHEGGIVLTVFGVPFARVTPLGSDEQFEQLLKDEDAQA